LSESANTRSESQVGVVETAASRDRSRRYARIGALHGLAHAHRSLPCRARAWRQL